MGSTFPQVQVDGKKLGSQKYETLIPKFIVIDEEKVNEEHRDLKNKVPIIGVGGVMSKKDYLTKLNAGADLVQIYTGFIIKGPNLINQIVRD